MVFATERWLREGQGSCVPVADSGRRRRGRRQSSRRPSAEGRADPVTCGKCEKCSAPPVLPPHLPHLSPKSSVPERRSLPREEPRPLSDWKRYGARSGADGPRRAPVVAAAQLRALGSRAGLSTRASQPASQPATLPSVCPWPLRASEMTREKRVPEDSNRFPETTLSAFGDPSCSQDGLSSTKESGKSKRKPLTPDTARVRCRAPAESLSSERLSRARDAQVCRGVLLNAEAKTEGCPMKLQFTLKTGALPCPACTRSLLGMGYEAHGPLPSQLGAGVAWFGAIIVVRRVMTPGWSLTVSATLLLIQACLCWFCDK